MYHLASAVLARPDINIMDEAISSIDTITESLIQKGIEELLKNSTAFIIAHRVSKIKNEDRILFIDNGEIQEMGIHSVGQRPTTQYKKSIYLLTLRNYLRIKT